MYQATRGWLQVNGIVQNKWSATSDIWPIRHCTLDFSISKELTKWANNWMSQSTWVTPCLLTSEHIFVARLKEYQWINKCQRMAMLTACDKKACMPFGPLSHGQSGGAGLRGTPFEFFPFFRAASHLFAAIQPAGKRWKGLPAGVNEQHAPPAHLLGRTKRHSGFEGV